MEKAARDAAGVHLRAGSFDGLAQGRAHLPGERRSGAVRIVRDDVATGEAAGHSCAMHRLRAFEKQLRPRRAGGAGDWRRKLGGWSRGT